MACSLFHMLNLSKNRVSIPLQIHLRLVLLILVAAHVAFFATALIIVNSCTSYISDIDKAGALLSLGALLLPSPR